MKRFTSLILVLALMVSMFSSCGAQNNGERNINDGSIAADDYITRKEWVKILSGYFGMDTYTNEEPVFSDVPSSDPAFAAVQSCAEWGALDTSESKFKPDKKASAEFAVSTAILGAGLDISGYSDYIQYANDNGLNIENSNKITFAQALSVIDWAVDKYLNKPFEEYSDVALNEDVVELDGIDISYSEGTVTLAKDDYDLTVGDIVMVSDPNQNSIEIARKITGISEEGNGYVLETEEPDLFEVYKNLDYATTAAPKVEELVPSQNGITIEPISNMTNTALPEDAQTIFISTDSDTEMSNVKKTTCPDFGVDINLTSGKLALNREFTDWFSVEATREKLIGDGEKEAGVLASHEYNETVYGAQGNILSETNLKYERGYEITGSLYIKDLYVESSCKTKKLMGVPYEIERLENEIHYVIEGSLSVKGKLEFEQEVFRTVFPTPVAGLWIELIFNLCVDANGDITVKTVMEQTTNVTAVGKNIKKATDTDSSVEISAQVKLWSGFSASITPKLCGVAIVDVSAKAGAGMNMKGVINSEDGESMICFDASAYFPTLTVSIGMNRETLAHKIGIKAEFDIMGPKGLLPGLTQPLFHYEISEDGNGFVDECTWEKLHSDEYESEADSGNNVTNSYTKPDMLAISDYNLTIDVGQEMPLSVTSMPHGYDATDIVFISNDEAIVAVDKTNINGTESQCILVGKGEGVTKIVVETKDGLHRQVCAVTVVSN